jgi:hypothetical protein
VEGWTPWTYLLTQTGVIFQYLRLTFVPSPLILHYAWPKALSLSDVAVPAAIVVALVALTLVALVRRHPLGFAGAWFFGVLAPTSSVVPIITEVAAEHRLYLPSAAIIAIVVASAYALGARMFAGREAVGRIVAFASMLAVVTSCGIATRTRNLDYADDERLWKDAVEKQPDSPRAQLSYGLILVDTGRFGEAESHLRIAAALEPMNPLAHRTLGLSLARQEKYREALAEMKRSLELFPEDPGVRRAVEEISKVVK